MEENEGLTKLLQQVRQEFADKLSDEGLEHLLAMIERGWPGSNVSAALYGGKGLGTGARLAGAEDEAPTLTFTRATEPKGGDGQ